MQSTRKFSLKTPNLQKQEPKKGVYRKFIPIKQESGRSGSKSWIGESRYWGGLQLQATPVAGGC